MSPSDAEFFRRLVEDSPDVYFRYRLHPVLCCDYVSPSVETVTGYSREECYSDPHVGPAGLHPEAPPFGAAVERPSDDTDPDERPEGPEARPETRQDSPGGPLGDSAEGPAEPVILRWIHRDGHTVWVEQRVRRIADDTGRVVALEGVARDITGRRRIEEELRARTDEAASIEILSRIVAESRSLDDAYPRIADEIRRSSGFSLIAIEVSDVEQDRYVLRISRGFAPESLRRGFGCPLPESLSGPVVLTGRPLVLIDDGAGPPPLALRATGVRTYVGLPMTARGQLVGVLSLADTAVRPVDAGLLRRATGVASLVASLTERIRVEAAFAESQSRYRQMFHGTDAVMLLVDPKTGRIEDANPAACAFYGYSRPDLLRLHARDLSARTSEGIDERVRRVCVRELRFFRSVHRLAGGQSRDVETYWGPVEVRGRTLLFSIIHDITERVRAEEALRESHRQLERALEELHATQRQVVQQERLRALGEMASGIAHDFNNALVPIQGFSDLLINQPERLADRETTLRFLRLIQTAAHDASVTVNRMREFYRPRTEEEPFFPVDVNALVEQTLSLTEPRWRTQAQAAGIAIAIRKELSDVPPILGNEAELREVLTNLIFNAVDAMPGGGTLTFRTARAVDGVTLQVSDTGVGMTPEVRERCLEPFFTTKAARGTGLGLSMVHGIVRRHEGTLEIDTATGQGTSLQLRFPASVADPSGASGGESAGRPRHLRILAVEDEEVIREFVAECLMSEGHDVVTAPDGAEGWLQFQNGTYDLVITDRSMPEMSGEQLAVKIKARAPEVPVILLTGYGAMMKSTGEMPDGIDRVLGKPLRMADLLAAVVEMCPPA